MAFFAPLISFLGTAGGGALASTAISVGASLAAGNSQKKAQNRAAAQEREWALEDQSEQFVRLRDAAEKAGFNPLTALRANPSGGRVNATGASLASNAFIGDAIAGGVDTYFNAKRQMRDQERDMLERKLMRQELANMQLQGKAFEKAMNFGFGVGNPTANNYTGVDLGHTTLDKGLSFGGLTGAVAGDTSDAEVWEKRYGDIASSVIGGAIAARDLGWWAGKAMNRWQMELETQRRQSLINGNNKNTRQFYGGFFQ